MQTQTRRRLLIWTLFCATWKLMMKNEESESLRASELNHLSRIFLNAWRKKNGEEYEPATVSSFRRSIQRQCLTYLRTMSSKNPEKSLQRSESQLCKNTAKETNRKLLRQSITWDQALFSFRFEKWHSSGQGETVAVRENVWEPLKLGLISG